MFSIIPSELECPFCKEKQLYSDHAATMNSYKAPGAFELKNLDKFIDATISQYWIFKCRHCGSESRYTYKDLEKIARQIATKRFVDFVIRGAIPHPRNLTGLQKVMVYCGKCSGYDGKGSCPRDFYKSCELRKFPKC